MKLYIKDFGDINFIKIAFPKIIINQLIYNIKDKKCIKMENYLNLNYSISLLDVVECLKNNLIVNKINNIYVIEINEMTLEKNSKVKLSSLIKLIDYGNIEVKGINLFNKVAKNLIRNIMEVYKLYMIKGGKL